MKEFESTKLVLRQSSSAIIKTVGKRKTVNTPKHTIDFHIYATLHSIQSTHTYRKAGNFCVVQIFAFFKGRAVQCEY